MALDALWPRGLRRDEGAVEPGRIVDPGHHTAHAQRALVERDPRLNLVAALEERGGAGLPVVPDHLDRSDEVGRIARRVACKAHPHDIRKLLPVGGSAFVTLERRPGNRVLPEERRVVARATAVAVDLHAIDVDRDLYCFR